MGQESTEVSNKVTVLVFKDNYSARTFQIPLNWITRSGIILGVLFGISVISPIIAFRYYRIVEKTDPVRVQELEQELSELKTTLKQSHVKESAPVSESIPKSNPAPNTPPPQLATTQEAKTSPDSLPMFNFLPKSSSQLLAQNSNPLPFTIQAPKAYWKGKTLKVKFALQYIKDDQGNQQGRILVFARGPDRLVASPAGTLNQAQSESFIDPSKGEPFSVSRYREAKAEFTVHDRMVLKEIEILIFSKENQLLTYQKHSVASILTGAPPPAQEAESKPASGTEAEE